MFLLRAAVLSLLPSLINCLAFFRFASSRVVPYDFRSHSVFLVVMIFKASKKNQLFYNNRSYPRSVNHLFSPFIIIVIIILTIVPLLSLIAASAHCRLNLVINQNPI